MFDPEQLLGERTDLGITVALIPRETPGHHHRSAAFPAEHSLPERPDPGRTMCSCRWTASSAARPWPARAGACWSSSSRWDAAFPCPPTPPAVRRPPCGPRAPTRACAASSTCPIARFEGIEAVIARMTGLTYTMDAARSVTAGAIDGGEKPSVPSAMLKYHVTEMGRIVANDAMDVHGGKGICLGPNNYLGARLPDGADRHHRRGRQHPHPQSHHLWPGRDPLPSLRAEGDGGGAQSRSRAPASRSSTARCSGTWASRFRMPCARSSWR